MIPGHPPAQRLRLSRQSLFAAVDEAEQQSIERAVGLAVRDHAHSWDSFFAGCRAFFDAALDTGFQRILIDASAVLGWQHMRGIEDRHLMALIKRGLQQAMEDGHIKRRQVDPLAHQLHGAMCEAAMVVARSDNFSREVRDALAALADLLNGFTAPRSAAT